MKNIYQLRNEFTLREYNTAISREDFEKHFTRTQRRALHLCGLDGKSYDNESRSASVYRTDSRATKTPGSSRSASISTTSWKTSSEWRKQRERPSGSQLVVDVLRAE